MLCLCLAVLGGGGYLFYLRQGSEPAAASPSVEYILDVSSRMELPAPGGDASRLEVARRVLADVVRPADATTSAGLRVFGSGAAAESCQDTDLLVPVAPASQSQISEQLTGLATGPATQPALAQAMIEAIRDLSNVASARSLVIVTGGQDLCSAEVGQLIARELEDAGIELKTFVIGFGVTAEEAEAIKEMLDGVEGGNYLEANNESELESALAAVQQFVDNPETTTIAEVMTPNAGPTLAASPTRETVPADSTPVAGSTPTTASSEPQATATEASGEEVTAVAPGPTPVTPDEEFVGETACDYLYFPLREGATWNYTGPEINLNWLVVDASGDQETAEVTMQADIGSDLTIDYHWTCTAADGIVSYDFGTFNLGATEGLGDVQFNVVESSGSFLPPGELEPGMTWQNSYTIVTTFEISGQSFSSTASNSTSYTAVGVETVTVAAGTFEAMRVESTGTTTTEAAGQSFSGTSTSVTWFARGVGMVKVDSSSQGVSTVMELTSYSIPE